MDEGVRSEGGKRMKRGRDPFKVTHGNNIIFETRREDFPCCPVKHYEALRKGF
jgi:hypothetical protein